MMSWLRAVIAACAMFLAAGLSAQVDQQLETMFNSMSTATPPGVYKGSMRGVVTGGSVSVRNRVMQPGSLISIEPPSISAGCGGIDMFGGSFSFISRDQFVAYLRSIASNAGSYAFKLGLKAVCPTCEGVMSELQRITQEMNVGLLDSCEAAQALVNATELDEAAANAQASEAGTRLLETLRGIRPDRFAATHGSNGKTPVEQVARDLPEELDKIVEGNIVWRRLRERGVSGWFVGGNDALLEDLMSMTGTVVQCMGGTPGCPHQSESNSTNDIVSINHPGPLSLRDLVEGRPNIAVAVLKCVDRVQCLDIREDERRTFRGMSERLLDVLLGPQGSRDTGGLIGNLSGTARMGTQEQLVTSMSGPIMALAMKIAFRDPATARGYITEVANIIAIEFTYAFARDVVGTLMRDLSRENGVNSAVIVQMQAKLDQIEADREALLAQARRMDDALSYGEKLLAMTPQPEEATVGSLPPGHADIYQ